MDRQEFLRRADECLGRVEDALDAFDPDEVEATGGDGVLTLEFADKQRYVLNRQTAASQMWFAAGARAWHFDWDAAGSTWIDDKGGRELYALVADEIAKKLGRGVKI
jgi:CyaY protein